MTTEIVAFVCVCAVFSVLRYRSDVRHYKKEHANSMYCQNAVVNK